MTADLAESRTFKMWKPELYKIQLEAPSPLALLRTGAAPPGAPACFGEEYHGLLSHRAAAALLGGQRSGCFLVRKGAADNTFFTLSWKFNNVVHHYKLFYDGGYYVKDKRYTSLTSLVAEGLLCLHMELRAAHITRLMHAQTAYTESPYVTLNRRKLQALSNRAKNDSKEKKVDPLESECLTVPSVETLVITETPSKEGPAAPALVEGYSREHSFRVHNFKGLNWCEFCANFLWGFTAQGVKCEDCGFTAHSKCSKSVPHLCLPDLKRLRGVFGLDLTTLLGARAATLPFVVSKCVAEIELRGMEQEGIYRISGFADEIEALKMALDKDGEAANLSEYSNINVVAGCLKLYLRLLPVPLLTHQLHPRLVTAAYLKTPEEQIAAMREAVADLPPAHYNTLVFMMKHLHRVSLLSNENKMPAHNLSTVLAPTLMAVPAHCTDLTQEICALQLLITHAPQIF